MAITQCEFDLKMKVTETIALGVDSLTDQVYIGQIATDTSSGTKTPTTVVPVTTQWQDTASLSAGALTIDLTSLAFGNLSAKTLNGLKVQGWKIRNRSTNTAVVTVAEGASNGYFLMGATGDTITIPVGCTFMFFADTTEGLPDVSATAKNVTFGSADTDATIDIQIVAG